MAGDALAFVLPTGRMGYAAWRHIDVNAGEARPPKPVARGRIGGYSVGVMTMIVNAKLWWWAR